MSSQTLQHAEEYVLSKGIDKAAIASGRVRIKSLLYMVYWLDRVKHNPEEHAKMLTQMGEYLTGTAFDLTTLIQGDTVLTDLAHHYVKEELLPVQTVDLVIERCRPGLEEKDKEVLLFERDPFPKGISLPGGLVEESDHRNDLDLDAKTFAALRIAGEKVLNLDFKDCVFKTSLSEDGKPFYSVENKQGTKKVLIHPYDIYGYFVKENLCAVIRPSDPRHLVDTVGFKCEIIDESTDTDKEYFWESKSALLKGHLQHGSNHFAFHHHKEIIFHMLARTSVEVEMNFNETDFVKKIVGSPLESYQKFMQRFEDNHFKTDTSFPELFPTVNHILKALFSEHINALCEKNDLYVGFRDKVVNKLRHVSLKNRNFCPYLPTLAAIFDGIAFFDVVARAQKNFYQDTPKDQIIEHNPKEKENAAYHMYKYRYRMDEMLSKVPSEIIIPTFSTLSATDLMRVRGVPIRFVGLSTDFIYVDEFEQSPEEFLMHDVNHSYRMMKEDEEYLETHAISKDAFLTQHNAFITQYLNHIQLSSQDGEKIRELKKLKKIILFEVVHEDAKPFLPDVIVSSIVKKEGGETPFEMPVIDEKTQYLDIVDVIDTEINTLSYVRNKLQCGFYDRVDKQNVHIVSPDYRKATFIAEAAMEMVVELSTLLNKPVEVDEVYLLQRTCSAGPDNIHTPAQEDEALEAHSDGVTYLNPKRYTSNQKRTF